MSGNREITVMSRSTVWVLALAVIATVLVPSERPGGSVGSWADSPQRPKGSPARSSLGDIVARMTPGVWTMIPGTEVRPVLVARLEVNPTTWGKSGSVAAFYAWTGAAYDSVRKRWYFHGGGHADYGGNEVYVFDFGRLRWLRQTSPSTLADRTSAHPCPRPAAGPTSSHTYDGIVWSHRTGSLWYFNAGGYCLDGRDPGDGFTWELRGAQWNRHPAIPGRIGYPATVEDSDRNLVVIHNEGIVVYDPASKTVIRTAAGTNWVFGNAARLGRQVYVSEWSRLMSFSLETLGPIVSHGERPADTGIAYSSGMESHPSGQLVFWSGGREIVTWTPATRAWKIYPNTAGPAPSVKGSAGPFSKWVYLVDHDIFAGYNNVDEGVWLYRLPEDQYARHLPPKSVCQQIAEQTGPVVTIAPGSYRRGCAITRSGLTIRGPGAHLQGAVDGKAVLVIKGRNTVLEDLKISHPAENGGGNLACVRAEGVNLTLRRVHCHDMQNGLLGGGPSGVVVIEDSLFERSGIGVGDFGHLVYACSSQTCGAGDELIVRRSRFVRMGMVTPGHGIKSRAPKTTIEDSEIAGLDARSGRLIDISVGGEVVIRGNTLAIGPNSENSDVIGVAMERTSHGLVDAAQSTRIEANTFLCDLGRAACLAVNSRSPNAPLVVGNRLVGQWRRDLRTEKQHPLDWRENKEYRSRAEAGLPSERTLR